ncbi:ATP-dependent DNA helicase [Halanaerobium hydrogeniformans]|uniref:DNA 3'-5' helicase n=1 Tax=Halanaerobium hydrogeniformans TaxID=656519 RepID=E4RMF4_HALHG|nr:ATP-dependent DNA helicase [Halanaerobium hydrogeniformans]ADQ14485.1 UvrD/REP helicase [Halanaerobium hydrogeniformans]
MNDIYNLLDFTPNKEQQKAIETTDGPLLIIAGPGSGKTQSLILRTVNLLANKKVKAKNILVCTFTEKAALQLRTRIANMIDNLDHRIDTSDIMINTIHGFCNEILREFTDVHPHLDRGFEVLDEVMQKFFINDNFNKILEDSTDESRYKKYLNKWKYKWRTIEGLIKYFNKLTQELISPEDLVFSGDKFFEELGYAYQNYRDLLSEKNYVDFAFLQFYLNDLLENKETEEELKNRFKYIMVDEFQDTNYIQETIIYKLIEKTNNICVVGDEDQSLYRFRGATVRNLLEFPKHFPEAEKVNLTINYRSHQQIIDIYNRFMKSLKWGNARFNKKIKPCRQNRMPFYNSVFKINEFDKSKQAKKVADFIEDLKTREVINDYSEVAILIDSVKGKYSDSFINALADKGIRSNCPRAKNYFQYEEIRYLLAAFVYIFEFDEKAVSYANDWRLYLEEIKFELKELLEEERYHSFSNWLREKRKYYKEIAEKKETTDENLLDVMYQMFEFKPFKKYLEDNSLSKYNLGIMSDLLAKFNKFYLKESQIITFRNVEYIPQRLFKSFFYVLHRSGLNEYEDREKILIKDHVSIMTIHQAKGLEFPVVIVSNLGKKTMQSGQLDKELKDFKHRKIFEDLNKINDFDYMRKYYVAFSRAENFLVLSKYRKNANPKIRPVWNMVKSLEEINKNDWDQVNINEKKDSKLKKQYSLTTDILVYDTCPRQYNFYKESGFTSSRRGGALFGSLVHETIEDVNKYCLEENNDKLSNEKIKEWYENNYDNLREHMQQSLAPNIKKEAFNQIIRYYKNNQELIEKISESELNISIEKPDYFISGKIDIILDDEGKYHLIDIKATKPEESEEKMEKYKFQLATYANLLKNKHEVNIENAMIYFTGAKNPEEAKVNISINDKDFKEANYKFDNIVKKIQNEKFALESFPPKKICRECDFRFFCNQY